jgi:hypothetical protein
MSLLEVTNISEVNELYKPSSQEGCNEILTTSLLECQQKIFREMSEIVAEIFSI